MTSDELRVTSRRLQAIGGRKWETENGERGTRESARMKTRTPTPVRISPILAAAFIPLIFRIPPIGVKSDYRTDRENSEKQNPQGMQIRKRLDVCLPSDYFPLTTTRLLVTEKAPGTLLARTFAMSLSAWLSTTPSSVTFPFLTIIRIGLITGMAYFSSAGNP